MANKSESLKDSAELRSRLAKVLATGPLYREFLYTGSGLHLVDSVSVNKDRYGVLPSVLLLECSVCKNSQLWETGRSKVYFGDDPEIRSYTCRNCRQSTVVYVFYWREVKDGGFFVKIGQYPALAHDPPKELRGNLDSEDADFYRKALDCRNFSYGVGALSYMRRVIENRINDVLDLAYGAAISEKASEPDLAELQAVKESQRFSDKLELAKKLIPPRLQPEGIDPIGRLYDSASEGMHGLSEEECVEIFDRGRLTFEHVFAELKHEELRTKEFITRLRALEAGKKGRGE